DTGIEKAAEYEKLVVYAGFDATAASLHLGHVIPILGLSHFQKYGHKPIILVGGTTALIGDPSGKQAERTLLDPETVKKNAESIKKQLSRFLSFEGENAALMVDNSDWLGTISLVDFLRDTGKSFSLGYILAKDSVKSRLDREQGISITEFLYALLQSYDYEYLYKNYGCNVQIGGSDQWGNITAGIDLIRKKHATSVHGITFPLLTRADGSKFGKTEGGAVWLDPELTSPYEMYQYWLNSDDRDIIRFLKYFTFLSITEIEKLEKSVLEEPEKREAHNLLAYEFTSMIHGEKAAIASRQASQFLFGGSADSLSLEAVTYIQKIVPGIEILQSKLSEGIHIIDALSLSELVKSKSEARRMIQQGGIYFNNQRADLETILRTEHLIQEKILLLRAGKKKYKLLNVIS
ncbi:MAG: tyrosine--tRNA ligase, partial [Leptospiraceae bacterium]|nr:tyrosine--tRNA ligase [Leptospiraceae bacterium]